MCRASARLSSRHCKRLVDDLEQEKDGASREPRRPKGKLEAERHRQPSEQVADAVSMAGQVPHQLCPDAGRAAIFVARFAEDLGGLAAGGGGRTAMEPGGDCSWDGARGL